MSSQLSCSRLLCGRAVTATLLFLSLFIFVFQLNAEKVGKLYYEGFASELNDSVVPVSTDLIAMAERINVPTDSSQLFIKSSSIFFIIDNSGSMDSYYAEKGELVGPMDPMGNRFEVTKAIIDTLTKYPDTYPGIECGLAVFQKDLYYDDSLDELLDTLENDTIQGAYIPLLKVDSSYTSGEDGDLTTQDIFYKYLKTQKSKFTKNITDFDTTVTWEAVRLTQPRDPKSKGGTNINTGFKAAVQAMKESKYEKENQFIVFISDGISSSGTGDDYEGGSIHGEKFMTTFTVYFTHKDSTPESLVKMNEAIKNNGYSPSNSKYTQLWEYKNSSKEELVDFFMENIVKVFEGSAKTKPKKLKLKDSNLGSHWDDKDEQFILDALIPYTGDTTSVNFEITLETSVDTLDGNGDIITIKKDTTISIDNTFWRKDAATPLEPNFSATYWDRNILFHYGGSAISQVDERMNEIDLIFTNDPMDSDYNYTECNLEVRAEQSGDVEEFTLTKFGEQYFLKSVSLERINGVPTSKNGVVEHRHSDNLIVTFRNSESFPLPLDTLRAEIGTILSTTLTIDAAAYYDTDGDGFIDSIGVEFKDEDPLLEANREEIVSLLQLPGERNLTIESSTFKGKHLALTVTEGNSLPKTDVKESERITTDSEVILKNGGRFAKQDLPIDDSLAPVILSASLRDNADLDTLSVSFSEPIDDISSTSPFYFYATKEGNKRFEEACTFLAFTQEKRAAQFEISDYTSGSVIEAGDSINMQWDEKIADAQGLFQAHEQNRKVEISAVTTVNLTKAAYFDRNADGFIDSIGIQFSSSSPEIELYKEELVAQLKLPMPRNFTVLNSSFSGVTLSLLVQEGATTAQTAVLATEKVSLSEMVQLGQSLLLPAQEIAIDDSLAPVILSASLEAYPTVENDTLTLSFSEKIEWPGGTAPFRFYREQNGSPYTVECSYIEDFDGGEQARFLIETEEGGEFIAEGDSIHIHWEHKISDLNSVAQLHQDNVKRPISVTNHVTIIEPTGAVYYDHSADGKVDQVTLAFNTNLDALPFDMLIAEMIKAVERIDIRELSVDSMTVKGSVITYDVTENWNNTNSAIMGSDEVVVPDSFALGKCLSFPACSVSIVDSMAPVIVAAHLRDSLKVDAVDYLELTFSEECDEPSLDQREPFRFFRQGTEYDVTLTYNQKTSSVSHQYQVGDINGDAISSIEANDSVAIDERREVQDALGNVQLKTYNIRRPITVEKVMSPIEVELKASTITPEAEEMYIQLEILNVDDLPQGVELTARGQLFDPVGNVLTPVFILDYDAKSTSALYVWSGANSLDRQVGAGSLLLIVDDIWLSLPGMGYSTRLEIGRKSMLVFVQR